MSAFVTRNRKMKVHEDSMNKKQLQRNLEAKEMSTQGTKADLELRLKERIKLDGVDITEFLSRREASSRNWIKGTTKHK